MVFLPAGVNITLFTCFVISAVWVDEHGVEIAEHEKNHSYALENIDDKSKHENPSPCVVESVIRYTIMMVMAHSFSDVFVHGLGGQFVGARRDNSNGSVWLRNILSPPTVFPRIMAFGYDADITLGSPGHRSMIIRQLLSHRDSCYVRTRTSPLSLLATADFKIFERNQKPHIFIGHSPGGMLIVSLAKRKIHPLILHLGTTCVMQ